MGLMTLKQVGALIEVREYERELSPRTHRTSVKRVKIGRRRNNMNRVRERVADLIRCNMEGSTMYFVTFTFRDFLTVSEGYKRFSLAMKRMKSVYSDFLYIAVPEFGTRGTKRLHFHVLFFNLPVSVENEMFTRDIANIWKEGFVDLRKAYKAEGLPYYFTKYLYKNIFDQRFTSQKMFTTNRKIKKPVKITSYMGISGWGDQKIGHNIKQALDFLGVDNSVDLLRVQEYNTKYLGRCKFYQYKFI